MARSSILTRSEIVTEGLQLGDNPGLTTRANFFLNLFLDEIYARFDWDFLLVEEQITLAASTDTVTMTQAARSGLAASTSARGAEAYRGIKSIYVIDQGYLDEWKGSWSDLRARVLEGTDNGTTGTPTWYKANPNGTEIQLYPTPDQSYTAHFWYYKQPGEINTDSTGDAVVPELPSANVMVKAVANFAAQFNRDPFHVILDNEVARAMVRLRNSLPDASKGRHRTIKMSDNFKWGRKYK